MARLWEMLRVQWRLWQRRSDLDAVYIRSHVGAFPTTLWLLATGIPVVHEVNGFYEDLFVAWPVTRRIAWLVQWIWNRQLRLANRILAVTPGLAERIREESGSTAVDCVPNGVNTDLFRPRREPPKSSDGPYAVFVGNLTPWQGIRTVLEAVRLRRWPNELKLLIVGDGAERQTVAMAADGRRIVYLGQVPYEQVPSIIAAAAVSLSVQGNLKNRSETGLYPLKVFESMACGVPVVVSDFPGQADIVRSTSCGVVVPPDDPSAVAEAVAQVYEGGASSDAMGRRGREASVGEHSWDARAGDVHEIFVELLSAPRSRHGPFRFLSRRSS